jgi:2-octaprenylphenol hydroxylase
MMGAMEGFKRLFEEPDPIVRWLRNTGMGWVNKQHFLKNQIAKHAMGLAL